MIGHVLLTQEQTKRKAMRVTMLFFKLLLFCHSFTVLLVATGLIMMKYGENGFCHFDTSVFELSDCLLTCPSPLFAVTPWDFFHHLLPSPVKVDAQLQWA